MQIPAIIDLATAIMRKDEGLLDIKDDNQTPYELAVKTRFRQLAEVLNKDQGGIIEVCPTCHEDMTSETATHTTTCFHEFHKTCYAEWYLASSKPPLAHVGESLNSASTIQKELNDIDDGSKLDDL